MKIIVYYVRQVYAHDGIVFQANYPSVHYDNSVMSPSECIMLIVDPACTEAWFAPGFTTEG